VEVQLRHSWLRPLGLALLLATSVFAQAPGSTRGGLDVCPEPNGDADTSCFLGPDSPVLGFLDTPEDLDAYKLQLETADQRLTARITDLPAAYGLRLHLADWQVAAETSETGTADKELVAEPLAPGTYYLVVFSPGGDSNPDLPYTLGIRLEASTVASPTPAPVRGDSVPGPASAYLVPPDQIPGFVAIVKDEQRDERGTLTTLQEVRAEQFGMHQRVWVRPNESVNRQIWERVRSLISLDTKVEPVPGWVTDNAFTYTVVRDGQVHRAITFYHRNGMGEVVIWAPPGQDTWNMLSSMAAVMASTMISSTN
jgi:hypothetical protein